jgi:type IV fimbrial biogenesis protein FimT
MESMIRGYRQTGLTLVEVLIALALLSVLLVIAAPRLGSLIDNNRLYAQSNEFYLALMSARSESMSRVQRVTLCASSNATSCGGNWEDGWLIFAEHHGSQNATVNTDAGDEILQVQQALSGTSTLRGDTAIASYISYVGTGFTQLTDGSSQAGTMVLCDSRGFSHGKAIVITATGQAVIMDAVDSSAVSCTP